MSGKMYALIVGIDNYPQPEYRLNGCVNDATSIKEFLATRAADAAGQELAPPDFLFLDNEKATRQAIIDGFRKHLGQAGENDLVFFHFSGHGSQELAPDEFQRFEPDGLNETLVCYDSRLAGQWDLADKEVALLLREIADRKAQITVVLDCCHSGSGTREATDLQFRSRHIPPRPKRRPLDSYLFTLPQLEKETGKLDPEAHPAGWGTWRGGAEHVLLAACRDNEKAKEWFVDGRQSGVFTHYLLDTLRRGRGEVTYRDVFQRASALVQANVSYQHPQLEAFPGTAENQPFLGGRIQAVPRDLFVRYDKSEGWVVDAGGIHGIAQGSTGEKTILALFADNVPIDNLLSLEGQVRQAEVVRVLPQLSTIRFLEPNEPGRDEVFKAVVIQVPLPPRTVTLEGDSRGQDLIRAALKSAAPGGNPSTVIREADPKQVPSLVLRAEGTQFVICRPADPWPLAVPLKPCNEANAALAVRRLEHIARWENTYFDLRNANGRVRPDEVEMIVIPDEYGAEVGSSGVTVQGSSLRFSYTLQPDGKWRHPTFKLQLQSRTTRALYCALLCLSEDFSVSAELLPGGGAWLPPAPSNGIWALNGDPVFASVPKNWWDQGTTEFTDVLKLIVSTQAFDARLMEQDSLERPPRAVRSATQVRRSTLNRLMGRVQTRTLGSRPDSGETYDDWTTTEISITTVRPLELTPIRAEGAMTLTGGVSLDPHAHLRASARLATLPQATRDLGNVDLPAVLKSDPDVSRPLLFTTTRGGDPGLQVLELKNVENYQAVTSEEPLRLRARVPLGEREFVLPVAFDGVGPDGKGGFFLPLGYAEHNGQELVINLERLPHPVANLERSLGGSIRIFFQKMSSRLFGTRYEYPLLSVAKVDSQGQVEYEHDEEAVKAKVAAADRILLFIHGIIGDTRVMAGSIASPTAAGKSLRDGYDLVLTFDYENLNTNLEVLAANLSNRLRNVGLGPIHTKKLDIVAHSMGGLVARWFIEQGHGNQVVRRLVMLGTPNAGSPWPTVQQWSAFLLTLGLNYIAPVTWPAKWLAKLVPMLQPLTNDLGQMKSGSDFLRTLADSPPAEIPYALIAGNTALLWQGGEGDRIRRLWNVMTSRKLLYALADPFFLASPNDIAVSVASMKTVPYGLAPPTEVACDHVSYFTDPASLAALAKILSSKT